MIAHNDIGLKPCQVHRLVQTYIFKAVSNGNYSTMLGNYKVPLHRLEQLQKRG